MDELLARHRKEQRDLQSRVTQKKKQASKKTRKSVNDECDRLEEDLKAKQEAELAVLNGDGEDNDHELPSEELEALTLQVDADEEQLLNGNELNGLHTGNDNDVTSQEGSVQSQAKKPNRQKARLARRAAEQEEAAKQAAEEAKNLPDLKTQERDRMLEAMKARGLYEKEINADGHCLFSAVADQLQQLGVPLPLVPSTKLAVPYKVVRSVAADYIQNHQDDFMPFLEEPLPDYVHKVRDTGEWGGQLELMALAKSYDTDINVLQDFGRVEKIESGSGTSDKAMWLGYYMHGFGLGEHYNSLRKAP